jgi:predicted O-methyltransferase YrrM
VSRELAALNPTLKGILQDHTVMSATGERRPLHSAITVDEGLFIQDIIRRIVPQFSLEVGCAYGISSLFICQALKDVGAKRHIIIDPFQMGCNHTGSDAGYEGIGLANLDTAGFSDLITFYAELSYRRLPRLESEGHRLDFAFIDGMHTFDYALVDFFYIDKMLNIGGVVIFDDLWLPSIRKLCRFILRNLPYSAFGPETSISTGRRRMLERAARIDRVGNAVRDDIAIPDSSIGLPSGNFVALRKNAHDLIGEGTTFFRRWNTHHRF